MQTLGFLFAFLTIAIIGESLRITLEVKPMNDNIFEEEVEAEQEEVKMKKTFGQWFDENKEWFIPAAIGGTAIALLQNGKRKRKKAADLEAEKQLIGQIAYQAGQKDAYRDVATRKRRNHHHNNSQ